MGNTQGKFELEIPGMGKGQSLDLDAKFDECKQAKLKNHSSAYTAYMYIQALGHLYFIRFYLLMALFPLQMGHPL